MPDFGSFFAQATGCRPYGFQERLARDGLPAAFWAPPGAGKTGVILAWLWRRLHGPDRTGTPRRLVYVLPRRAVLDEVPGLVRTWLENLGLAGEVALHVALGDRGASTGDWREDMHRPAIVVGTAETLVSKALLRGYAIGPAMYPIDFGLVTNGAQWIVDEARLCRAAATTLRQLAGWAGEWGTAEPFGLTLMSSLPLTSPARSSLPGGGGTTAPRERSGPLAVRLGAARTIRRAPVAPGDYAALASAVRGLHRPGTTTLVVLGTVPAAQSVYRELGDAAVARTLLHSQLRGVERTARLAEIAASPSGRIVVSTTAVAAGLDLSAAVLVTEAAPWPSTVRLAGRCNRDGTAADAEIWWLPPAAPPAAERLAVDAACAELSLLDAVAVTGEDLASREVFSGPDQAPVISRAEFLALFDTSAPEVDVARYLLSAPGDTDVDMAWVTWAPGPDGAPDDGPDGAPDPEVRYPAPEYRCRVPAADALALAATRPVLRLDRETGRWRRVTDDPGWRPQPFELLLVPAARGGYDPEAGYDPSSWLPVPGCPELLTRGELAERAAAEAAALGVVVDEAPPRRWQSLDEHSRQVRDQCAALLAALAPAVPGAARHAAVTAAYLHDLGKAHPIWQDALCALAPEQEAETIAAGRPWAKSGVDGALLFAGEVSFRHELASMLLIDGPLRDLIAGLPEPDLVRFLVLAHHGKLRMRVGDDRALATGPGDAETTSEILGLRQGKTSDLPPMLGRPPTALTVDLEQFSPASARSWTRAATALRDRFGPFALAYLETLVRVSDWRGSGARELATDVYAIDAPVK